MSENVFPTTTEDEASVDGQQGIASMAVRNDADATLTDADGDESRISVDASGKQKVRDDALLTATTDGSQLTGVLGEDGTTISSPTNPVNVVSSSSLLLDETLVVAPGATDETTSIDLTTSAVSHFVVSITSDQVSAADGFRIQYSQDNVTFYTDGDGFTFSDTAALRRFPASALARYARIQFEADSGNGADANARIQIIQIDGNAHEPQHKISTSVSKDRSTQGLIKSGIIGYESISDSMKNVPVNRDGHLKIALSDVLDEAHRFMVSADNDTFGSGVVTSRANQVDVQFYETADPDDLLSVISKTGSATSTSHLGDAHFSSGADLTVDYTVESRSSIIYYSAHEIYLYQTLAWTQPPTSAGDFAESGIGDIALGELYSWCYKGTSWGIRYVTNGSEVSFIPQASFNSDPLDGSATSRFTRGGVPEVIDLTKINIFRIRFGWLGSAPTHFEVLSPDGQWVIAHVIKHPNSSGEPQITTPNLPVTLSIRKNASDTTDIQISTGCWAGGVNANILVGQQPDGDYVAAKADGTAFETRTPLGAGATYDSRTDNGVTDTDGWGSFDLVIATDQVSGTDGIIVNFVRDSQESPAVVIHQEMFTFSASDVADGSTAITSSTRGDGLYVTYLNGGTPQGTFDLQLNLRVGNTLPQSSLNSDISSTSSVVNTRGGIFAENDGGVWGLIKRIGNALRIAVNQHEVATPILAGNGWDVTKGSIGTTPAAIPSTPLASRITIEIHNSDNNRSLWIGTSSAQIGASQYRTLEPAESIILELDDTVNVWARSDSSTCNYEIIEIADTSV